MSHGRGLRQGVAPPGCMRGDAGAGATNASIGVHCARHDSTPLVLLVGQVARAARGREAGQEIDYTHFFGSIAKWVIEVNDPRRVPEDYEPGLSHRPQRPSGSGGGVAAARHARRSGGHSPGGSPIR